MHTLPGRRMQIYSLNLTAEKNSHLNIPNLERRKPINTTTLVIFILSTLFPLGYHHLNLAYLRQEDPQRIRQNISIVTADDASYLAPAMNFYQGDPWRADEPGIQSYFLRPPGYGILYLGALKIAGPEHAFRVLLWFQILAHALAATLLFTLLAYNTRHDVAFAAALLFGILPTTGGFLFYTLTEGITPALALITIFLLWKYHLTSSRYSWIWLLAGALSMAGLMIIRPVLAIFLLCIPAAIFFKENTPRYRKWALAAMALLIALSPSLLWQIRNYSLSGSFTGLHPVYHPTSPGIFRPAHQAMWNLCKSWAMPAEEFHSLAHTLFDAAARGDTTALPRLKVLQKIPPKARRTLGDAKLLQAFSYYQKSSFEQHTLTRAQTLPMPETVPPAEQATIGKFNQLTQQYRTHHPIETWAIAPLRVLYRMVVHSNLNLHMFQHTWRGNFAMELFRFFSLALHLSLFAALIPAWILFRRQPFMLALALACILYIAFLAFYQRGIEERYTLPLLPILFIFLAQTISRTYSVIAKSGRYKA